MKITVVNQPLNNRGDEAAHRAFIHRLLKDGHEVRVLFACNPQKDIDAFRVDGAEYERIEPRYMFYKFGVGLLKKGVSLRVASAVWRVHPVVRNIAATFRNSDMVICAPGGTCLGHMMNWMHLFMLLLAQECGCRTGYFARSIGPFDGLPAYFRKLAEAVLRNCWKISLRDMRSCEEAERLGLSYIRTIDSAFLELPRTSTDGVKLPQGDYIVFVPNELSWHSAYRSKLSSEQAEAFFLKVLNHMLNESGDAVVMLPQLFNKDIDDETFFKKIASACDCPERVTVCPDNISSDVQQTIIAGSRAVVGSRYHSVVFAINNCRPFVAFSYEHKISGMLEMIDLDGRMVDIEELGLSDDAFAQFCSRFAELREVSVSRDKAAGIALEGYKSFMRP